MGATHCFAGTASAGTQTISLFTMWISDAHRSLHPGVGTVGMSLGVAA
jgi:hypothetical protein